jgi:hypothetical protein
MCSGPIINSGFLDTPSFPRLEKITNSEAGSIHRQPQRQFYKVDVFGFARYNESLSVCAKNELGCGDSLSNSIFGWEISVGLLNPNGWQDGAAGVLVI